MNRLVYGSIVGLAASRLDARYGHRARGAVEARGGGGSGGGWDGSDRVSRLGHRP